ncbi:uncharacterized protein, partial [Primulina eburnea]|uniref:uncharacterized protein n=1 Tax=Primulina eburnea TaxID=1245227 RepID=UPI003C6C1AFF
MALPNRQTVDYPSFNGDGGTDIEEDIKALQLDSSEDTIVADKEDGKIDVELILEVDKGLASTCTDSKPLQEEQRDVSEVKEKEISAMKDVVNEVENKKRHLNVVFIGHV